MTFKSFISIQFLIIVVRGLPPILLFMIFNRHLLENEMANLLTLWSFGNILSAILLMSSMTAAPQYFFKNSKKITKYELKRASYFQLFRLILFITFSVSLTIVIYFIFNEYMTFLPLVIYNMMIAILPIWKEYSTRNLKFILKIELIFRMPVLIFIIICQARYIEILNLFNLMIFLSSIGIIYIIYDIHKNIKGTFFLIYQIKYTFLFIYSILQVNILMSLLTVGQVFFYSLFTLSDSAIVQAGMMERIKNIFLQIQGIFLSERLSKNRDYIQSKIFNMKKYILLNLNTLFFGFLIYIVALFLYFINIFDFIFGVLSTNHLIGILILTAIPTSMLTLIFISHIYNSKHRIKEYTLLYHNAFFISALIIYIAHFFTSYIFISMALLLDIIVIVNFIFKYKNLIIRK